MKKSIRTTILWSVVLALQSHCCLGQDQDTLLSYNTLKKLSLEELLNLEVISVSKRPEKINEVASAIQVITQKDIIHSGAKTLAEALRLAANLQVAQVNASQWAISARGFNNVLANKLLVLVDGRTVYTPLYAGVFWDVQNYLLEDIDRIEIISGPGGTLWGANAVNGVINIITKSAADTKGFYAEAAAGGDLQGLGSLRYGGGFKNGIAYRLYGTGFKIGNTMLGNKTNANDKWPMFQGGLRMDWNQSSIDKLSYQLNIYGGKPNPDAGDTAVIARGDNMIFRWNHKVSEKSDFQLQAYYDHTWRDFGNGFTEDLKTYDIEWQNRLQLCSRHLFTYGLDFRLMDHKVDNLDLFGFFPGHKSLYRYSLFLQDEIELIKDRLHLNVGGKIEHNSFTGFEYQPNGRLTWNPAKKHTVWTAVSRAVRTPARIDRDFALYLLPGLPYIEGSKTFRSETMIAYELGWRWQPFNNLSLSLATFNNVYDHIRTAEPGPPPNNIPITFGNGVDGNSHGIELSAIYQPNSWWNIRGGYTFLKKHLSVKSSSSDLNNGSAESNDPMHQFLVQSSMNFSNQLEVGTVVRYIGKLSAPKVPDYLGLDLRICWKINKSLELSLVAQNLLDAHHAEFIPSTPSAREIERTIYGKIICRF